MGADLADAAGGQTGRPSSNHPPSHGDGCDPLQRFERLPAAHAVERLPADLHSSRLFYPRRDTGLWKGIKPLPVMTARDLKGHEVRPSAGLIDSQSARITESGGVCGYDAGRKVKGRKRHIMSDTLGLLLTAVIHSSGVQGRDGTPGAFRAVRYHFPWLRHVGADGGYAGDKLIAANRGHGDWPIGILKRSDTAKGFNVLPRRWVVKRTFACLGRCRRLTKDREQTLESATASTSIASIRLMTQRLARYCNLA